MRAFAERCYKTVAVCATRDFHSYLSERECTVSMSMTNEKVYASGLVVANHLNVNRIDKARSKSAG